MEQPDHSPVPTDIAPVQQAQDAVQQAADIFGVPVPAWLASGDFWVGIVEVALACYFTVSLIKHVLRRTVPGLAEHKAQDFGARYGTMLLGIIYGPYLIPAPALTHELVTGACAGWFAVPIYMAVKKAGGLLGGRWAAAEKVVTALNGPGVGPGKPVADSGSVLPAETGTTSAEMQKLDDSR